LLTVAEANTTYRGPFSRYWSSRVLIRSSRPESTKVSNSSITRVLMWERNIF